jgi:hypothetical protein
MDFEFAVPKASTSGKVIRSDGITPFSSSHYGVTGSMR